MSYLLKKVDVFIDWLAKGFGAMFGLYIAYEVLVFFGQIPTTH